MIKLSCTGSSESTKCFKRSEASYSRASNSSNLDTDAYTSSMELVLDKLRYLDLLLYLYVLKQEQSVNKSSMNKIKEYVTLDKEADSLLMDSETESNDNSDVDKLTQRLYKLYDNIESKRAASFSKGIYLSLDHIVRVFNLTKFEEMCIIICLAIELDPKYGKIFSYLQEEISYGKVTVGLILNVLCFSLKEKMLARSVFTDKSNLTRYLIRVIDNSKDSSSPFVSRIVKLEDRIVNHILEIDSFDPRISNLCRYYLPQKELLAAYQCEETIGRVIDFVKQLQTKERALDKSVVIHFYGTSGTGKRSTAWGICDKLGHRMLEVDIKSLLQKEKDYHEAIRLLGREALLNRAILCFINFDSLLLQNDTNRFKINELFNTLKVLCPMIFLTGEGQWTGTIDFPFIDVEFKVPDEIERVKVWKELSQKYTISEDVNLAEISSKFNFSQAQIKSSLDTAKYFSCFSGKGLSITGDSIHKACRVHSNQSLIYSAQKLSSAYDWDDLILPAFQKGQLRDVCNQLKYRNVVLGQWGFGGKLSRGKGLNLLFSGPSGTGKTTAAEVMANELKLELYRIDLSQIVSKYIGETEKNLNRIFYEAQTSNAILFFDEADALFGKRSDVKDAHDRYANIEVAYLLQKMDEYQGISILATNFKNNLDEAFTRRIQVLVDFPVPDEKNRKLIWKNMLPKNAPLGSDIDLDFLSKNFGITGGDIKNIVLNAAFFAAESNTEIRMEHFIKALGQELMKMGRVCMKSDFGDYYELLDI